MYAYTKCRKANKTAMEEKGKYAGNYKCKYRAKIQYKKCPAEILVKTENDIYVLFKSLENIG